MISNRTFQIDTPETVSWVKALQHSVMRWIRQEVIDDDPDDQEKLAAQKLYEKFLAAQQAKENTMHPAFQNGNL